jgi:hypothetical protein
VVWQAVVEVVAMLGTEGFHWVKARGLAQISVLRSMVVFARGRQASEKYLAWGRSVFRLGKRRSIGQSGEQQQLAHAYGQDGT